jgi:endogenous inhibitor of DNA gyrase (YacG/DUF329 family)
MLTPFKFVTQCAVEERDDGLYVAGVRIDAEVEAERAEVAATEAARRSHRWSGVPLAERTVWKVDALAAASGSNVPVYLSHKARLHRCARCGAPFLAHPSARGCSEECRTAFRRESQRKQIAKRTIKRVERRAALKVECRQCGKPVDAPSRSTRAFCSNACRQAAYRARSSTTSSLP